MNTIIKRFSIVFYINFRQQSRTLIIWMRLIVAIIALSFSFRANAEESRNVQVTMPNGYANITAVDLSVASRAGKVAWTRQWNGQEWKFNPQWESLSQSWGNLTGSRSADTTGNSGDTVSSQSLSASTEGCWVWVDEDWEPVSGGTMVNDLAPKAPLIPSRSTPFNRLMGEDALDYAAPKNVSLNYAALCAGSSGGAIARDAEGIRKINELYLGDSGRYAFDNRSVLEKRAVKQLASSKAGAQYPALTSGQIDIAPITNAKGYRWIEKGGSWIDYNTQGQMVAFGDNYNNTTWMVRDDEGVLLGVADASGHVLYSLHYDGKLLSEVRDYGLTTSDIGRTVKYQYDLKNRLIQVTDPRGFLMKYDYDIGNHIVKITDQESHSEVLEYSGDLVVQRTAADGGVTNYVFEYDAVNKQFSSKVTGPETSAGRLVEIYVHNSAGKLVRKIVNGQTETELKYDSAQRVEYSTNIGGKTTKTTRNEFDQVVEIVFPDGAKQSLSYSALHLNPLQAIDELNVKTVFEYNDHDTLIKETKSAGSPDERITDYTVNDVGNIIKITNRGRTEFDGKRSPDAIWTIDYDEMGQVKQSQDPEGNIQKYQYDHVGNLVESIDANGNSTHFSFDELGNLISIKDSLGRIKIYERDKVGNLISMKNARGNIVALTYDEMNREIKSILPLGNINLQKYDFQGMLVRKIDAGGTSTYSKFDSLSRQIQSIDGSGNVTEYIYDGQDSKGGKIESPIYEPAEVRYPTYTEKRSYDQRDRFSKTTIINKNSIDTDIFTSGLIYDNRGMVKEEIGVDGKRRKFTYNSNGEMQISEDQSGNKSVSDYDARGNLVRLTDPNGNSHLFEYDRNDRLIKDILPLGQIISYEYDHVGNLVSKKNRNGEKQLFSYNKINKLIELKRYNKLNILQRTSTYDWDEEENLQAWSDVDNVLNLSMSAKLVYDKNNRKISEVITYPNSSKMGYEYRYSPTGQKTAIIWPDGTLLTYGYEKNGKLNNVVIPGQGEINVNEFNWDSPSKITFPGGTTEENQFDGLLNVEFSKVRDSGQQELLSLKNVFNNGQTVKAYARSDTINGISRVKFSEYQYDDNNRLSKTLTKSGSSDFTDIQEYTFDPLSNRILNSPTEGRWVYDANNRLIKRGSGTREILYFYDEEGNRTQNITNDKKGFQYGYDAENQLVEVKNNSGEIVSRYGFDPFGRRVWKEQYRDYDDKILTTSKRSYFLYADEGLLAESAQDIILADNFRVEAVSVMKLVNLYGVQPNLSFSNGFLFVKTIDTNGNPLFAYLHRDILGSPVQATNKNGDIVWAAEYDVYGKANIVTPAATEGRPKIRLDLRLPGQIEDSETGLHYNYHRTYDPDTGRYLQSDPIGLAGGMNPYVYVGANPVTYVDSFGLSRANWKDSPMDPNSIGCKNIKKRIENNQIAYDRQVSNIANNANLRNLPYYAKGFTGPGGKNEESVWGHEQERDKYKQNIEDAKDEYLRRCGGGNGPSGTAPVTTPPAAPNCPNCKVVKQTVFAATGLYILYRCIRMIPSAAPPLWWTIPANIAVP